MDGAGLAQLVEHCLPYAATALPSLIVAATPYPKASRALQAASHVLQFFSVLSHRDCPGTLKAPGKVHSPKVEEEPAVRHRPEAAGEPPEGGSEVAFLRRLTLHFLGIADHPETSRRRPSASRRRRRR